jgi:ABC-type multidrug transport system fused ATPase/permease subunit
VEPAAQAAWSISTHMLRDIAQATVVIGIPAVAYSLVAVALLLVIAWAPIPATRMPLPVLVLIVLAFAAMAALRRQVAAEFPEAQAGATRAALQGHATRAVRAVQGAR